ncbi:MAG: hypothetical protein QXI33_02300 [Candidatus Pacearchaeota archaeon]
MVGISKVVAVLGLLVFFIIFIILSIPGIFAITGKIGNGKMVLYPKVGETLEKSIKVINDNDVPLNITLFTGGNNSEKIQIYDKNFILEAGETKDAKFSIKATSPGKFENKIFVQFSPLNENETGVGLTSQIILFVKENEQNKEKDKILIGLLGFSILLLIVLVSLYFYSLKFSKSYLENKKETGDKANVKKKEKLNANERKK